MTNAKASKKSILSAFLYGAFICVIFFLCSRSFSIPFIQNNPLIRSLYTNLSRVAALAILIAFAFSFKKMPKKLYLCLWVLYGLLLFSTILEGGNLRRWLGTSYPILAMNAFVILECNTTAGIKRFTKVLSGFFTVLITLNFLQMVFLPTVFGVTASTSGKIFLLAQENQLIYPLTIGLLFVLLSDYFNQDRAQLQFYSLIYFLTVVLNFSVGSLMGATVLLVYLLFPSVRSFFAKKPFTAFLCLFLFIFILLVFFFEPIASFPPIRFVIENILHKDVTLTHRTKIWRIAFQEILKKPLFGQGYGDTDNFFTVIAWGKPKIFSAHNQYIQTWYIGGTAAIATVVGYLLIGNSLLQKMPDKNLSGKIKAIAAALMIMLLVEAPTFNTLLFTINLGAVIALTLQKENHHMTAINHPLTPLREELISVVIPVYNVERYLKDCLDSVLKQSFQNLEIILVDDGSTDNSCAICKAYAAKDPRIKLITQENGGLSAARNTGIAAATGQYITFVDSDDAIALDMIQQLYDMMIQHGADLTACQKEFIDEQGNVIPSESYYPDRILTGSKDAMNAFFQDNGLDTTAWGKLYKTTHFSEIRYPVGKYHEDVYTTYQLVALSQKTVVTARRLYLYRQRANSIIHESFSPKHLDAVEGSLLRAEYVAKHFPKEASVARSKIVYAANSCVVKLMRSKQRDKKTITYLQKQYRTYEWDFLKGNSKATAKLFSVFAYINLPAVLKATDLLFKLRRMHSK